LSCPECGNKELNTLPNQSLQCESCGWTHLKPVKEKNASIDFETINQSVFRIKSGKKTGTGFIIHEEGYFITNAHIIKDLKTCDIFFEDGTHHVGEIIHIAEEPTDLAIGKLDTSKKYQPLTVAKDALKIAETVYAVGNPKNLGLSVSKGTLSRKTALEYQCDLTVNPGNSGGPIINESGEVVGVISYVLKEVSGLAFAVSLEHFIDFLKTPNIKAFEPLIYEKRTDLKKVPINTLALKLKTSLSHRVGLGISLSLFIFVSVLLVFQALNRGPYTIEFTDGNGNIIETLTVERGETFNYPDAPFKEGHTFKGWSELSNRVSRDLRIVPLFEINTLILTIDYGNRQTNIEIEALKALEDIAFFNASLEGYYFDLEKTIPLSNRSLIEATTIYAKPYLDKMRYPEVITNGSFYYYIPEYVDDFSFDQTFNVGDIVDDLPVLKAAQRLFEGWALNGELLTLPFMLETSRTYHLTPVFSEASLDFFYYKEPGTFLNDPSQTTIHPISNLDLGAIYFWPEIPDIFNHKVYIIGMNGTESEVVIPSHIHNREVISVQTGSPNIIKFNDYHPRSNAYIETLSLPDSIRFVYQLHLPMLNRFIISEDHPYLNLVNGALHTKSNRELIKFPPTLNTETYLIHKDVEIIRDYAFHNHAYLSNIQAETGSALRTIGFKSFYGISNLEIIEIPRYVDDIHQEAFGKLPNLIAFEVNERNLTYETISGLLVKRQNKALIAINAGAYEDVFNVPDSIKSLELGSIDGTHFKTIVFSPESELIYIYHFAIINNRFLESVVLPGTIKTLYGNAFSNNENLSELLIHPSESEDVIAFISNLLPPPDFDQMINPELFDFFGPIPTIYLEERLIPLYLEDSIWGYYHDYLKPLK